MSNAPAAATASDSRPDLEAFRGATASGESVPVVSDPAAPEAIAAPAAPDPAPAEAQPDPQPAEPQAPPSLLDRNAIAERFARRRQAEDEKFLPKEKPPFVEREEQDAAEASAATPSSPSAPEGEPAPTSAPIAPQAPLDRPELHSIKVRGQTYSVTRDQLLSMAELTPEEADGVPISSLVRIAQKNDAARSYLEEAKTTLQGARQAAPASVAPPATPSQPTAAPAQEAQLGNTDPLLDAVERIQYGDPAEARPALARAIHAEIAQSQIRDRATHVAAEGNQAIADFAAQNPDIAAHPVASDLLLTQSVRGIVEDFARLGAPQEVLATLLSNPEKAYAAYREARVKGLNVRAPRDILASAGDRVREALSFHRANPNPQPASAPANDRVAAKRALPQQPTRSVAAPAQAPAPAPQSRSDAVRQMRVARGQPV